MEPGWKAFTARIATASSSTQGESWIHFREPSWCRQMRLTKWSRKESASSYSRSTATGMDTQVFSNLEKLFDAYCNLCSLVSRVFFAPQVGMVACALMTRQTSQAYREVFHHLKQLLPQWTMDFYMGDFDSAMRSAVAEEFPGVRIYGCFFHYAQCLVKKAGEVGLAREIRQRGSSARKLFLAFTALPLLPSGEIEQAFHFFSNRALGVEPRFAPFLRYMRNTWLDKIRPEGFSVFRSPCETRTNNAVESHNAFLLRGLKNKKHGPIWDLIGESFFVIS